MINPALLRPKVMKALKENYRQNNPKGVQIQGFMDAESYKKFLAAIAKVNFRKAEIRDTHSYFEADLPTLKFFSSNEFLSFADTITGKKLKLTNCSLKIFMAGCYTLMHDEAANKKGIEFYFDLTPQWNNKSGGAIVYLTKAGEKLAIPPSPNMLVLAGSGESYVKYVNHLAGDDGRLVVYGMLE